MPNKKDEFVIPEPMSDEKLLGDDLPSKLNREQRAERRAKIADEVRKGIPPDEVAKSFGVTIETVRKSVREAGHRMPSQRGADAPVASRTLEILAALIRGRGKTVTEIAAAMGVSKQRVSKVAAEADKAGLNVDVIGAALAFPVSPKAEIRQTEDCGK